MGRTLQEYTLPTNSEIKAEKKKRKKQKQQECKQSEIASNGVVEIETEKTNGDYSLEVEAEANRKRKIAGITTVTEKKKKRKEKKEKKEEEEQLLKVEDTDSRGVSVMVTGKDAKEPKYAAFKSFSESKLPDEVLQCCCNFSKPSQIQSHAWPFLLGGRDFIGIAATGSGKTLAFGVPAMMHVLSKRKSKKSKGVNPLCLVLSPTRELAQQISDVLCEAGKHCGVKSVCLYGGTSKGPQISVLKSGVV